MTEQTREILNSLSSLYPLKDYEEQAIDEVLGAVKQPKRGKWIKISPANIYECSECGKSVMTDDICAYDFCHGCGAEMEVTK